jgi:hypothetical protein
MPNSSTFQGLGPVTRQAIGGTIAKSLSASGSTQSTATKIGADHNSFSTVGASQGAVLQAPNAGEWVSVFNGGANALSVYPNLGATINGGSANAAVSVAAGKGAIFIPLDALTWFAVISA